MFSHLLHPNANRKADIYLIQVGSRMIVDLLFFFLPFCHGNTTFLICHGLREENRPIIDRDI